MERAFIASDSRAKKRGHNFRRIDLKEKKEKNYQNLRIINTAGLPANCKGRNARPPNSRELTGTHSLIHSEFFIFYVCSHSEDSEGEKRFLSYLTLFELKKFQEILHRTRERENERLPRTVDNRRPLN